jgi:hypothetical protein
MQVQALGNLMKNGNNLASYAIQMARRTHKQPRSLQTQQQCTTHPSPQKCIGNLARRSKERRTSELRELELDGDHSQWHAISDDRKTTSNGGGRRLTRQMLRSVAVKRQQVERQ